MIDFTPIISYLSQRPDITFAYVFGSVLTEYFIEGKSDIDLAIMGADKEFTFYDLQEMAMDISDLLPGHPEVDMVDLMTDAPVLIHQIMEHGQPLFVKDELVHDLFYCTQSSKFIDHQAWSKQFDEVLREGILTKSNPQ